jgi:hypothetical protein
MARGLMAGKGTHTRHKVEYNEWGYATFTDLNTCFMKSPRPRGALSNVTPAKWGGSLSLALSPTRDYNNAPTKRLNTPQCVFRAFMTRAL